MRGKTKMRTMGLDFGEKRIGVAISDPSGLIAQGIDVIRRKGLEDDISRLREIIEGYRVEEIVIGMPRNMNGSLGRKAEEVQQFIELLKSELDIPLITWDERLSTHQAEGVLIEADMSRAKRKKVIDRMSAVVILQNYLDSRSAQAER